MTRSRSIHHSAAHRGFSMIEVVVASLMVGTLFVSAIGLIGEIRRSQKQLADTSRARHLAGDLMSDILVRHYEDPDNPNSFGHEPGESPIARPTFDDIDDFDGYTESPPQLAGGTEMAGFDGWSRRVEVVWVASNNLATPVTNPTGIKRITVTVTRDGKVVASDMALRSDAWIDPVPRPDGVQSNQAPVAAATLSSVSLTVGESVTLGGLGSYDPNGDPMTYAWDFGDGNTDTGTVVGHMYSTAGDYTVRLRVTDDNGGVDVDSVIVHVAEAN